MTKSLGQVAYEAWCGVALGAVTPWHELDEGRQGDWIRAAERLEEAMIQRQKKY